MEKTYSKQLVFAFILLLSSIYTNTALAVNTITTTQGTQLAYFYGYHYYPGYWGSPYYHSGAYWTPWRYIGYGCRKSCLISKWSGKVIRCTKRCY